MAFDFDEDYELPAVIGGIGREKAGFLGLSWRSVMVGMVTLLVGYRVAQLIAGHGFAVFVLTALQIAVAVALTLEWRGIVVVVRLLVLLSFAWRVVTQRTVPSNRLAVVAAEAPGGFVAIDLPEEDQALPDDDLLVGNDGVLIGDLEGGIA